MKLENPHLDHFPSLVAMFFDRAGRGGEDPFLWRKADRAWQPLSWRQVANQVAALAHNLRELGLKEGDRITSVNNQAVKSADDVMKVIEGARKDGRSKALFQIETKDGSRFLALPIDQG